MALSYLRLFLRGFLIVSLTSANVVQISRGHYLGAFGVGFGISFFWWGNAHRAAHTTFRCARETYAFGAAAGTLFGMWISRLL